MSYAECNIEKGCIIQYLTKSKAKMKKVGDEWITTDELELWFANYKIVNRPVTDDKD